jgi:hypothetical protein
MERPDIEPTPDDTPARRPTLPEMVLFMAGALVGASGAAAEVTDVIVEQNNSNGWPAIVAGGIAVAGAVISYIKRD